jgi:peptidoglycan DL-endopeptidase CwlO
MWASACLVLMATLATPPGVAQAVPAAPRPSLSEAKKKLQSLNEQVDGLVEKYNQVSEDLKAAKRKYTVTQKAAEQEQATFERLRGRIVEMAQRAYKTGDTGDVTGFVSAGNPQNVLDQAAVFAHLSNNRTSELAGFLASAQRLQRQNAQAKSAYDEVATKAKELRDQKQTVERAVAKQRKLVNKLAAAASAASSGSSGSSAPSGGTYNGTATGSARQALQYAYAQLGKPYAWGGAGPNSFDCSGLTMMAWRAGGVSLPRTTYSQYDATRRVAFADLQPGDLVFFNSLNHMGIYVGSGKMIHAPHTGSTVQTENISSGYYRDNFYGAGRP